MRVRPLALDLCSGLGGWAEGLEAEGWEVIRVDIVDMFAQMGVPKPPGCLLILQDIRTFCGSQARRCDLIVASPPCTEFSWMAMPWSRAKQVARALRGEDEFPVGYRGSRTVGELTCLFDACFRIQREACEAAGRRIPMVVENVRGAQPWVGRSRWAFGSFHLWGDVPALVPIAKAVKSARPNRHGVMAWTAGHLEGYWQRSDAVKLPGFRFDGRGGSFQTASVEGVKGVPHRTNGHWTNAAEHEGDGLKVPGIELGEIGFNVAAARRYGGMVEGVKIERTAEDKRQHIGTSRKFASAMIARIPYPLSLHVARVFKPRSVEPCLSG